MDIWLFITSSITIGPCFHNSAQLGEIHQGTPQSLLTALRIIGVDYEKRLLQSTHQVNTQRGILFAGSLLAAAAGWLHGRHEVLSYDSLSHSVKLICRDLCHNDFAALYQRPPQTHGEKLFQQFGVTGVRGEAENGFPLACHVGLPALHQALEAGLDWREALVHTLLALMAHCDDTTVLSRGGYAALTELKSRAQNLVAQGGMQHPNIETALNDFNAWCLQQWVSPGGSADLLALCLAMYFLCHSPDGEVIKEKI